VTLIPDLRRRLLAQLHIAKKQLGLDDATWRAMLWTVARVRSSADLDAAGLQQVRDHLVARGAKLGKGGDPKRPRVARDRERQLAKIEALLADAGRPWEYLTHGSGGKPAMVMRICGVERIEFCLPEHLGKLIAALEYDRRRRREKDLVASTHPHPSPPIPTPSPSGGEAGEGVGEGE
jgi:phage gp16-like protein